MSLPFLNQQTYPFSVAAQVGGLQRNTLKTWIKRKNITFSEAELLRADKAGLPHQLSYGTVVRIAITWRLVRFGMNPSTAWLAALKYTLAGGIVTGRNETTRLPGELYKTGQTWLVVKDDGSAKVVNFHPDAQASVLSVHADSAICLHMNVLIEQLDEKLSALAERSAA
jgi:hypothetical protein